MKIVLGIFVLLAGLSFASANDEMSLDVGALNHGHSGHGICSAMFRNIHNAANMCSPHGLGVIRYMNGYRQTVGFGCDCRGMRGDNGWRNDGYNRRAGWNRGGWNRGGWNRGGWDRGGYRQPTWGSPGYDPICYRYPSSCDENGRTRENDLTE